MGAFVLPHATATSIADQIVAQLASYGEHPIGWRTLDQGRTFAFGVEIITDDPKWTRSVEVGLGELNAPTVQDRLNAWRERIRADLHRGQPSKTVRDAIQAFGAEAVIKAMEHVSR